MWRMTLNKGVVISEVETNTKSENKHKCKQISPHTTQTLFTAIMT